MAYMYDEMGNVIGEYESEEERKRREELANTEIAKTEVKTYADGTQEEVTKRQIPARPVAPTVAPGAPAVSAPVAPTQDPLFNSMVRAESGGQQFNKQGGILTSPKGAQGIAQIMPATAANPGFGIAPATPEEIATKEGNLAFGQRYKEGMDRLFGGDPAKTAAAYNAGPGRVQQAEQMAAQRGGSWTDYIPKETRDYIQKTAGAVLNAVIPSAQAGTLTEEQRRGTPTITPPGQFKNLAGPGYTPYQPPAPEAAPAPQTTGSVNYGLSTGAPGIGLRPTTFGQPATQTLPDTSKYVEGYQAVQDDINGLFKYRSELPEGADWLRKRTDARIVELSRQEDEKAKAQQRLDDLVARQQAGDVKASRELSREMTKDSDEGSWVKMLLLSYISPQLAGAEAAKLGLFNKTTTVYDTDGKISGEVVVRADGKAVKGTFLSGQPMSQRDLLAYSGAIDDKKAHVSRSDNFIDPDSGQVVTKTVMSDGKERFTAGGKPYTGSTEALVPEAKFSDAENRRVSDAITALRKEYPNPTQDQVQQALVAARVPNRRIELEMGLKPGSLGTGTGRQAIGGAPATKQEPTTAAMPTTTTQAPTGTQPAPAAAPAQAPVITTETQPQPPALRQPRQGEGKTEYDAYVKAENEAYQKRLEAFQNRVKLEQKEAQEFREKRFDIQSSLSGLRNSIDVLERGEHNLGPTFNTKNIGQSLPKVQQWLGEAFGTDQSANTTKLLSIMNRDGLQGIKNSMGPAISNFDVETWMKNNPVKPNMPPEAIKAWFVKTHNAMLAEAEAKKQNALKHGMIESGFDLGKPVSGDKRPSLDSFKR